MPPRLPRIAAALEWLALLSLVLLPVLCIVAVLSPGTLGLDTGPLAALSATAWTWNIWLALGVMAIPLVLTLVALDGMRRLFRLYRAGDPLDPAAGPLIYRIGMALLLSAVSEVVLMPVRSGLLSLGKPPGQREISIGLSSGDVGFILIAGLLYLIGWSMTEAQRVATENREFV